MFQTIRSFVALRQITGLALTGSLDQESAAEPEEHYLGFVGIPNPPDGYQAPLGASPYTWPAIYNNKQNIDFCVENFSHLKTRIKCMEGITDGPLLP